MTRPTIGHQASEKQVIDKQQDKQHKRALSVLLEKSVAAIGLGAACLVAPSFLEPSPSANAIAAGLRMGGWIAIALGLVLLVVRLSVQSKARKRASLPRRDIARVELRQDSNDFPGFIVEKAATSQAFAMQSTVPSPPDINSK